MLVTRQVLNLFDNKKPILYNLATVNNYDVVYIKLFIGDMFNV